jgi:hypothetical protein
MGEGLARQRKAIKLRKRKLPGFKGLVNNREWQTLANRLHLPKVTVRPC